MQEIIKWLLLLLEYQRQVISILWILAFGKSMSPKSEKSTDKPYGRMTVDPMPVFEKPGIAKIYDSEELIKSKNIKPVKRRGGREVPADAACPYCGASHEYQYANNGAKGQYLCKVCGSRFNIEKPKHDDEAYCPFCHSKLDLAKKRKDFDVYRCPNMECPYRKRKLSAMTPEQRVLYKKSSHLFKVRFIYRKFHFRFVPLSKQNDYVPTVDLPKITVSPHILGLILTYHINYGLPLRKTAALMFDVHGVKISHQSIANYCDAVAPRIKPFIDHFPYELSDSFCGDETYIKVKGVWHYIFFFFDATKKIILSYRVQKSRDYQSAVLAINDVLAKLRQIPENLNLVTDGNPIYLLARQFFAQHGIHFDVTQVIGLSNNDPVSTEFRPLKQIIERLNRTFKGNYKPTTGYSANLGAVSSLTLFVAFFNFLRPHSALDKNVPVLIPDLLALPNMPAKWCKLIKLSEIFVLDHQRLAT